MTNLIFPKGFLWGATTAAHQVEGNTRNDWSEWEKQNAARLAQASEANFRWNPHWKKFEKEATNPQNYISGNSCDHYHRYEEDFDLAQSLHHNAHRFSIEWSRIEPEKGVFDEQAIEHYRAVLKSLKSRGMKPFVTLLHFTLPLWLAEEGGVLSREFPEHFARYTKKIASSLGSEIEYWITINEPDVYAAGAYLKGIWPPMKKNLWSFYTALRQQVTAHQKAYRVLKEIYPDAEIGIAKHNVWFEAAGNTLFNRTLKWIADHAWNFWLLDKIKDSQDFIGLNHYHHHRISGWYQKNENKVQTDFGWEFYPESLYFVVSDLKKYNRPIYITENGLADAADALRPRFIREALLALHRAIQDGADVRGYFYWSLLDNFEWDKGFWLRFGLIEVDRETLERRIRPSAKIYTEIIQKNALEIPEPPA